MEGKELEVSKKALITRAFRRSNVRWRVAEYLFKINPNASYISEIAYNIHATPTNVIGALRGMGTRYRREESLVNLNIVEEIDAGGDMKLYRLTDFGKEAVQMFMKNNKSMP